MSYGNAPRENYRPAASKQDWSVGKIVKIGFMSLEVVAKISTPSDYRPDAYALKSTKGQLYQFVPHFGLTKFWSLDETMAV